jgi:hypothetical protein
VRREVRIALVKSEILAAYFNYLHSRNEDPKTPEDLKTKTKVRILDFYLSLLLIDP